MAWLMAPLVAFLVTAPIKHVDSAGPQKVRQVGPRAEMLALIGDHQRGGRTPRRRPSTVLFWPRLRPTPAILTPAPSPPGPTRR